VFCLTELKCAVYADGELPEEEGREVTRHLAECGTCRQLADSLRFESRALIQCLQEIDLIEFELEDELLSAPQASGLTVTRFAAFVLAIAVLLRPVFTALGQFQLLFSASEQFDFFVDAVMYGIPAAIDSMDAFLNVASWIVVGAIVCAGLFMLFRKSPIISTLVSVLTLLTVFSPWTYAIDVRRGEKPINVPAGETIDDTVVVTGDSAVDVDGTINGDLIALAREVRVKGTVKGNLISFAERTEIDGAVEGSVFGTGGAVEVRGNVGRNLYALAGNVVIAENARIDGNASILIGEATLEGSVGKDVNAYSARAIGWGRATFSRSLFSRDGAIQVLGHDAHVGRNLFVKVDERQYAVIDPAATIGGETDVDVAPIPPSRYATARFYVWQTIWLAATFLAGLILFSAVPRLRNIKMDTGHELLVNAGIGLTALVVPPIAAVIAGLTLVGLPLGLMTTGLWIAGLYLSKIVIAAFLGRSLIGNRNADPSTPFVLLAGLVPVFVAINLPYFGSIIHFLLIVLGLGALVTTIYPLLQHNSPSRSATALPA
jgi:cytoskeletal protein CcmA (bactofilin family)